MGAQDDRDGVVLVDAEGVGDLLDLLRRAAALAGLELVPVPGSDAALRRGFLLG